MDIYKYVVPMHFIVYVEVDAIDRQGAIAMAEVDNFVVSATRDNEDLEIEFKGSGQPWIKEI